MPGIDPDIICHKLSIKADAKPVKQKARRINEEQSRSISDEVDHLLQAGFIRESLYPDWLSNPVLVKKKNENRGFASTSLTSMKLAQMIASYSRGSISQ